MTQNQNFGIMDEGYFVPRSQILNWVNDLLKLNLTKIQQLGSGAVYCQILDAVYPGKISMGKVNWKAKIDYEFLNNYKILQSGFDKFNIKRYIDVKEQLKQVERLSKARHQDNLEFIQWLKRYYQINSANKLNPYHPQQRRGNVKIDFGFAQKTVVPKSFGAGGQIIPKNRLGSGSKEKRGEFGSSGPKDSARRLVSPQISHKNKVSSQEKKQSTSEHTIREQKRTPQTSSRVRLPPNPHRTKEEPPKRQSSEDGIRPNRGSIEQLQRYKKTVRDLQAKLEMIAEISNTNDDAEIKMKLIEEVLSIGQSKLSRTSEQNNNKVQSPVRKIERTRTEQIEVIPQSIHVNESSPQAQTYTFQAEEKPQNLSQSKLVSETEQANQTIKSMGEDEEAF